MKKTKIICTMGPNTNDRELMKKLVENGMDIARFNFSHGDHEEQKERMDMLKSIREEVGRPVAILLDTKGPEIRTGLLKDGKKVILEAGQTFTLTTEEIEGDAFEQAKKYFLQGYESEKALEPDYEPKCRLMRRFCNLFSYARLVYCIAEEVPDAPEWMVSLRNRLTLKIQYLENIK